MTKFYFVRHGKTEWNLEGRYQGAKGDSPLVPQSYQEIAQLGKYLVQIKFDGIYCSPIKRARTTAKEIARNIQYQGQVIPVDAFREFNLGKMEGMKFTAVAEEYPAELDGFRHHPDKYDPTTIGGETFQEVFARFVPEVKKIAQEYPDGNILIVSHGAVLCAAIRNMLGVPLAEIRARGGLANTSTTILETKDQGASFKCLAWNKTSYLRRKIDPTDIV